METEKKRKPFKKYGFWFRWFVELSRESKEQHGDQQIRQCEQDRFTIDESSKDMNFLKKLQKSFAADPNIFFFVHDSQMMFFPIFCIVLDITTPEEYGLLGQTTLAISKKFKNFSDETVEEAFLKMLYSEENKVRVLKHKLRFEPIGAYKY